jgi:hypothetical protein
MKFRKRVLTEDRDYHSPDGPLSVNREVKAHWAASVNRLVKDGFDIPMFWDHPEDPEKSQPVQRVGNRRRRAKGQAGWLTSARMEKDGSLGLEFDIPESSAKQVSENLTKVSPVIWDELTDGKGQTHRNIIGAVDLVTHPVDTTQSDFEPSETVACSLLRFSLNADKPSLYRLAEDDDMADEDIADDVVDEETDEVTEEEVADDGNRIRKVLDALAAMNIVLSEDTNAENLLEHLEQALLTAAAMGSDEIATEGLEEAPAGEFAQLSLETQKWRKRADIEHRKSIAKRLSVLLESGRCTPAEAKAKTLVVPKIRLSLDANGKELPSQLESWLESREAVPAGTFWDSTKRTRMAGLKELPQPSWVHGDEETPEQAEEVANEMFKKKG